MFGNRKRIEQLEQRMAGLEKENLRLSHLVEHPAQHKVGDRIDKTQIVTGVKHEYSCGSGLWLAITGRATPYWYWKYEVTNTKTGEKRYE